MEVLWAQAKWWSPAPPFSVRKNISFENTNNIFLPGYIYYNSLQGKLL